MIDSTGIPLAIRQKIALEELRKSRIQLVAAKSIRLRRIRAAKHAALTNATIGEALGITEGAVRGLLARSVERA